MQRVSHDQAGDVLKQQICAITTRSSRVCARPRTTNCTGYCWCRNRIDFDTSPDSQHITIVALRPCPDRRRQFATICGSSIIDSTHTEQQPRASGNQGNPPRAMLQTQKAAAERRTTSTGKCRTVGVEVVPPPEGGEALRRRRQEPGAVEQQDELEDDHEDALEEEGQSEAREYPIVEPQQVGLNEEQADEGREGPQLPRRAHPPELCPVAQQGAEHQHCVHQHLQNPLHRCYRNYLSRISLSAQKVKRGAEGHQVPQAAQQVARVHFRRVLQRQVAHLQADQFAVLEHHSHRAARQEQGEQSRSPLGLERLQPGEECDRAGRKTGGFYQQGVGIVEEVKGEDEPGEQFAFVHQWLLSQNSSAMEATRNRRASQLVNLKPYYVILYILQHYLPSQQSSLVLFLRDHPAHLRLLFELPSGSQHLSAAELRLLGELEAGDEQAIQRRILRSELGCLENIQC